MPKKKILFITNRNIINTCGELRLIKNRAENLYHHYGFATDFIAFTNKNSVRPELILAGGTTEAIKYSKKNLVSFFQGKIKLEHEVSKRISTGEYGIVIISGPEVLPLVRRIKQETPDIITIADCHGATEELIEFDFQNPIKTLFRHTLYRTWKIKERNNYRYFDHVLAVSESLKRYLVDNYSLNGDKIHTVPCATDGSIPSFEVLRKQRNESRRKYSIKDDEILFVYSGGTSKWQCIEETVDLFKRIKISLANAKLLLLSGDKEYISKFLGEDVIIDSLEADEVKRTLPAADYTFLLRDNYITNNVAFPNKFLEYVESGAKIIATPYVEDIALYIESNNIGYVLKNLSYEDGIVEYIRNMKEYGEDYDKRESLLQELSFKNRLKFFEEL